MLLIQRVTDANDQKALIKIRHRFFSLLETRFPDLEWVIFRNLIPAWHTGTPRVLLYLSENLSQIHQQWQQEQGRADPDGLWIRAAFSPFCAPPGRPHPSPEIQKSLGVIHHLNFH